MNERFDHAGIQRYRKFMRWSSGAFVRWFIWWWFAGCAAVVAISVFHLDKRYGITLGLVFEITIWPALIGWLTISGVGILWHLYWVAILAIRDGDRPDFRGAIFSIALLATGIVFLAGAIGLTYAVWWRGIVSG